ncbi:MAG: hypothetical protein KF784_06265 [Fimbriimonadaceae bacterium]|nr:hypothetical protein [Fimbriimonadaceae bacterium]
MEIRKIICLQTRSLEAKSSLQLTAIKPSDDASGGNKEWIPLTLLYQDFLCRKIHSTMATSPYLVVGLAVVLCAVLTTTLSLAAYLFRWTFHGDLGYGVLLYAFLPSLLLLLTIVAIGILSDPRERLPDTCRVSVKRTQSFYSTATIFGFMLHMSFISLITGIIRRPSGDNFRESSRDFAAIGIVESALLFGIMLAIIGVMLIHIHAIIVKHQSK